MGHIAQRLAEDRTLGNMTFEKHLSSVDFPLVKCSQALHYAPLPAEMLMIFRL